MTLVQMLISRGGLRRLLRLPVVAALVLPLGALAGCGDDAGTGVPSAGPTDEATVSRGPTALEIDLYPPYGPDVRVGNWTLTCEPADGTLPNAEAACDALLADPSVLQPPACEGEMITDQRSLRVTGTLRGQPIDYQRGTSSIGECTGDQDSISAVLEALGNPVP